MITSASPNNKPKSKKSRVFTRCRSQVALDSLPRNARGNNAAIHRLQARNAFRTSSPPAQQPNELGIYLEEQEEARDAFGQEGITSPPRSRPTEPGRLRRSLSLNRSSSSGANSVLAKRAPPVSSADLPPASSDLEQDPPRARYQSMPGTTTAGLQDEKEAAAIAAGSSVRSSPKKAGVTGSPMHRGSPAPARKRVVVKSKIGNPTNFKHTGHIGASAYGSAISGANSDALKAQLSEVAAALKFDNFSFSLDAGSAPMLNVAKVEDEPALDHSASSFDESQQPSTPAPARATVILAESRPTSPALSSRPSTPLRLSSRPGSPVLVTVTSAGYSPQIPSSPLANGQANRKRKQVPQVLPAMDFEAEESQLNREVSVVGKMPNERDFAKFAAAGSLASRRMKKIESLKATNGDGTLKRWGLAEAFNGDTTSEETETVTVSQPQKNMVEGPAGTYITDTANFRWNSALDEIKKALADDGTEEQGDRGMDDGMKLADEMLKKLGVEGKA